MFENEIKFISDFTLNKVKDLGSFFTVEKLLASDIHPSLKKYIEAEIDYLIYEDRKKLIENSLFEYSGTKISHYFNLIGEEIKKTKKVSYEDMKKLLHQAVSFNANYLVRPKWSVSKLIFGNNKSVTVTEMDMMLNFIYYFDYLKNVVSAYIKKKNVATISITEFELILNKVDREMFSVHQDKLIDNALYSIADFFSIGGLGKSSISVESVETFLKEKNLMDMLFKLKRTFPSTGRKKVEIEDIRKVFYTPSPVVPSAEQEPVESKDEANNLAEEKIIQAPVDEISDENIKISELPVETESEKIIEKAATNRFDSEIFEEEKAEDLKNEIGEKNITEIEENIADQLEQVSEKISEEEKTQPLDEYVYQELKVETEPDVKDEFEIEEITSEEEILDELTKDVETEQDEEEVLEILDGDQEQELLNFYDEELEISIDDENETHKKDNDAEVELGDLVDESISEIKKESEVTPVFEPKMESEVELQKVEIGYVPGEEKNAEKTTEAESEENDNLDKMPEEKIENFEQKIRTKDIFSFLSKKEIKKIINNVFNSDSEDFANTVEKLSDSNDLDEAQDVLKAVLDSYEINPNSKDAAALINAVAKYFNQG